MPKKLSISERALRGLVFAYLAKEYPRAAQLMEAQAMIHDFEADDDGVDANDGVSVLAPHAVAKVFGPRASLTEVVHRRAAGKKGKPTPRSSPKMSPKASPKAPPTIQIHSKKAATPAADSDDDAPPAKGNVKPLAAKLSPKHAAAQARRPIPAMDSDDEAPAKPASRKATPKIGAAKKPIVHDSDSDDDAPTQPAAAAARKPSPKLHAKKAAAVDSDDDAAKKPAVRKPSPKAAPVAPRKPVVHDTSDDEDAAPRKAKPVVKKASPKAAPAPPPADPAAAPDVGRQPGERFCRIAVDKVQFANERLKDNRCRDDTAKFMQNQKMLAVRGKEFNKHKQKNKAKLYAAGVDQGVHSYKFDDDSS